MIKITDLSFSYGKDEYIKNFSLEVSGGEIVSVIGKNGSGKTTLLKLIGGYLKRSGGDVLIDGESIDSLRGVKLAKRLSFFHQGREIPNMTVGELVLLGRYPYNTGGFRHSEEDISSVRTALARLGIEHLSDRMLEALSYGERQRAYLAMNLAEGAGNLLFDEQTSYMDAESVFSLMDLLVSLKNEGKAIVAVLHDISSALKISDKIIVMQGGEALAIGTPSEIISSGILCDALGVEVKSVTLEGAHEYIILPKCK